MKRFTATCITLIFAFVLTFSMTGCGGDSIESQMKESLSTTQDELDSTFQNEETDFPLVEDYIKSWAKSHDIKIITKNTNYIILENPATEGAKGLGTTTLQCSINTNDSSNSLTVLAAALTSLSEPDTHGKLRLIVTEYTDGQRLGADKVPAKYLKCDNFINLQYSSSDSVFTSGANTNTFTMTTEADTKEPAYSNAYTISLSMREYADPYNFEKSSNYPNPVKVLGDLLASCKSSGKLFEVVSFNSSCHDGYTPYNATVTVVIDDNNVEAFKKKFDKSYENMSDKFDKLEDTFVYTMDEAPLPDKVLSEETSNNLISLMYTLNTGICYQDEDTGVISSASYIKTISIKNGKLKVIVDSRARGAVNLDTIDKEYEITSGLCMMHYSKGESHLVWDSPANSDLSEFFTERVPLPEDGSDITLKAYDNDIFAKKASSLNIISYTFSGKSQLDAIMNIYEFTNPEYEKEPAE